jgi:hypothetical protein
VQWVSGTVMEKVRGPPEGPSVEVDLGTQQYFWGTPIYFSNNVAESIVFSECPATLGRVDIVGPQLISSHWLNEGEKNG